MSTAIHEKEAQALLSRQTARLIHEQPERLHTEDGAEYTIRVFGERRSDGFWQGWLEFASASGDIRRTAVETTQACRRDLEFWATGLEPVYLEGAFDRAREIGGR